MSNCIDVSLIYNNYINDKIANDKNFIIKKYTNSKKEANYTTIKYNKSNLLADEYNTTGLSRSIILNNTNKVKNVAATWDKLFRKKTELEELKKNFGDTSVLFWTKS